MITIKTSTEIPIYQQIVDAIKFDIIAGNYALNESLPSIRSLAKELKVSVITTKRAYEELEREGYVHTIAGKGTYVKEIDVEDLHDSVYKEVDKKISELIEIQKHSRTDLEDFKQYLIKKVEEMK